LSDNVANSGPTYRVPRGGMDHATKRLALLAAGLGGTLFVVLGAWSTLGGHSRAVPTISAPAGPMRVKPANPGGLKVASDSILSGGLNDSEGDKLAPAPEAPDPQGLKAAPPPAPRLPLPAPAPAPTTPAVVARSAAKPVAPPPAPAIAEHAPRPAALPAVHGAQVQLASLPTREAAEAEWKTLARRDGPLLAGRAPVLSEATVNGRTWFRVRTGGFADEAQAKAFCDKLRAAGGQCSVARS
jgi:hypothetical protein